MGSVNNSKHAKQPPRKLMTNAFLLHLVLLLPLNPFLLLRDKVFHSPSLLSLELSVLTAFTDSVKLAPNSNPRAICSSSGQSSKKAARHSSASNTKGISILQHEFETAYADSHFRAFEKDLNCLRATSHFPVLLSGPVEFRG